MSISKLILHLTDDKRNAEIVQDKVNEIIDAYNELEKKDCDCKSNPFAYQAVKKLRERIEILEGELKY